MELEVLYEQGPCLVLNKPAGILTQAPAGIDSLEVQLRRWLARRDQITGPLYLGLPHRLDRPVTGAIVFARTPRACRQVSLQFEERRVGKSYWAFVEQVVAPGEGTWTDYIYKVHGMAQAQVVPPDHPGAKRAMLHYRVLAVQHGGSWLEIVLETGRTHQIRVQAASRGHPVLGDSQYGSRVPFGQQYDDPRLRAIALHARHLAFAHPIDREEVAVEAPLSPAWDTLGLPVDMY